MVGSCQTRDTPACHEISVHHFCPTGADGTCDRFGARLCVATMGHQHNSGRSTTIVCRRIPGVSVHLLRTGVARLSSLGASYKVVSSNDRAAVPSGRNTKDRSSQQSRSYLISTTKGSEGLL